mmetsp:Transcript_47451/g.70260  ORF Transcript_47451/g.70260 Transcript_47451/m.70260 type:complete len:214 (-) Transcript_47451:486-1127(-)
MAHSRTPCARRPCLELTLHLLEHQHYHQGQHYWHYHACLERRGGRHRFHCGALRHHLLGKLVVVASDGGRVRSQHRVCPPSTTEAAVGLDALTWASECMRLPEEIHTPLHPYRIRQAQQHGPPDERLRLCRHVCEANGGAHGSVHLQKHVAPCAGAPVRHEFVCAVVDPQVRHCHLETLGPPLAAARCCPHRRHGRQSHQSPCRSRLRTQRHA